MKLTVVIPALNEEDAIGSTIERCLAAREEIVRESPVDRVEIIVVSDGSTDRTVEIARAFDEVRVIVFEKNRGYGAAIKKGFEEGTGQLVGFLDADGTCDPNHFATLCRAIVEDEASVALGSRMGPQSQMPRVRRLGNRVYALLLSALSNRVVSDTASGMRVIRRDALPQLYPLPDGLHFTPAMSARVIMDDRLKIVERPMSYVERIGESKLHVLRDGVRFLRTIFEMSLMWRPAKMFIASAVACFVVMLLFAMHPIETWLRLGRLQEDVIYRLLFCSLLGTLGVTFLSAGVVSDHLHRLIFRRSRHTSFAWSLLERAYSFRGLAMVLIPSVPLTLWLVGGGVMTWVTQGFVETHWSRVVPAGLIVFGCGQLMVTTLVVNLMRFHAGRIESASSELARKSAPTHTLHGAAARRATPRMAPPSFAAH